MYLLQTKQIDHTNKKLLYPWKYSCDNSEILNNISELEIYYSQYCFPIMYKNKNYLVTTAHNTNKCTEFYYHDLQLPIIIINYDLDIIILENIISDKITYNFELKLNFFKNEIFNNNMQNIMLNFNKVYESNISFYTANILLIECDILNNSKIIKGQSGFNCMRFFSLRKTFLAQKQGFTFPKSARFSSVFSLNFLHHTDV